MRHTLTISEANNYIRVFDYSEDFVYRVIRPFCRIHLSLTAKVPIPGTRQTKWVITHVFARFNHDKTEFRICRELLDDFVRFVTAHNYHQKRIKFVKEKEIEPVKVEFKLKEGWAPRPHQVEWLEYNANDSYLNINVMNAGEGKTSTSLFSMVDFGWRTTITVQPRYITTWIKALGDQLELEPEDVILAEGDLVETAEMIARGEINPKVIIIPMTRFQIHLKREKEEKDYPTLDYVYEKMGVGLRIMDEGHEAIHQIYLSFLYGNIKKSFALSGTLEADSQFTNKIYRLLYPNKLRLKKPEKKRYLDVIAYMFRVDTRRYRIKTQVMGMYNDMAFEKSMMSSNTLMDFYLKYVLKGFEDYYLPRRREKSKCLLFFSKNDMCERVTEMLKQHHPDLDIISFHGKNNQKNKTAYLEHEIVVTTPGSCGTGKDIPGLVNVHCHHTVSSKQRNEQIFKRLREFTGEFKTLFDGMSPLFLYGLCPDIEKQMDYHHKRKGIFDESALSQKVIDSGMYLN